MAANQNIARLGVVLGIETGEYTREINEIIQKNKEMKREVDSATKAITREIEELAFATQNYGKTLTKVEQVEQSIQRLRYTEKNVGAALIRDLKAQAAAYDAKVAAAQKAADLDKKAGGLNKQQIAALGYQTTDIITGLAGGQNPLLVLIQQGGQLRDQFGGVKGVFDAFKQVLTPTKLLIGGVGSALLAFGYAAYSGSKEFARLRDDLILTNSYAGLSTARFNDLAQSLSTKLNVSIGDAKEGLGSLVASGKFTQQSLESVGKAVLTFAKLAGIDAKDAAQELMGSLNGTASGAKALNDKYHFLNLEQYKTIELLEKQGKTQQAITLTAKAFNDRLDFTGVVLTKLDGDTRGGAALSIKYTVHKPIKFMSSGEKLDTLTVFHPERMAQRILGMGDITSLVEKAQMQFDEAEAKKIAKKLSKDLMTKVQISRDGSYGYLFDFVA